VIVTPALCRGLPSFFQRREEKGECRIKSGMTA